MGASQSRGCHAFVKFPSLQYPSSNSYPQRPLSTGVNKMPIEEGVDGYFILCLKRGKEYSKIKIVNASNATMKTLKCIIHKNAIVVSSGWGRHLAYSYRVRPKISLVSLTAELLLSLYAQGWEPLSPIDMSKQQTTAICFRRSTASKGENEASLTKDCLCIETFDLNGILFHQVPNVLLMDLILALTAEWSKGIRCISEAVHSVISDYSEALGKLSVVPSRNQKDRFLRLNENPWRCSEEDSHRQAELLMELMIGSLTTNGYRLQMDFNISKESRAFFFIKDNSSSEVKIPTFSGNEELYYVLRPPLIRRRTSFLKSRRAKKRSLKQRIQKSVRRNTSLKNKKLDRKPSVVPITNGESKEA